MLDEFFKKLEKSKWLLWVGTAPFVLLPVFVALGGEVARGVGMFAFFASMYVGVLLGARIVSILSTHLLRISEDTGDRLSAAFGAFGAVFLPWPVVWFFNTHLAAGLETLSFGTNFLLACMGAGMFFCISPERSGDED